MSGLQHNRYDCFTWWMFTLQVDCYLETLNCTCLGVIVPASINASWEVVNLNTCNLKLVSAIKTVTMATDA